MNQVVPVLILLMGALLILGGTKVARRFSLPDAFGCGVALCIIATGVWLSPADWRDWWAGGPWGDRLLTSVRIVGLTGMFFLAGTRFNSEQLRTKVGQMLGFTLCAGVLFAVVALLLKLFGRLDAGPIFLVAATIVASSLWLSGELSRVERIDNDLRTDWQAGAVMFTALVLLAVYFYDVFAVLRNPRSVASMYIIVALYESVKLIVLFAFAYFVTTRFLARAQGRISTARTTIGFVLIAILIFALAALTTNQLGAIAWAFVAGALWRRSEIGKRFSESERPLASATLISLVFLPLLLQSHGRRLTGFQALIAIVLAAIVLKWVFVWVAMRSGASSPTHALRTSAALVGPGEVGILLLGFGMTRWAIEPTVYFGILGAALLSIVLTPLVYATVDRQSVVASRKRAMKGQMKRVLYLLFASLAVLSFSSRTSSAQQPAARPAPQEIKLGSGMSAITPGLMEIGSKTRLFLVFGDKIPLTAKQRNKLEDLYFRIQMYSFQREEDLDVAEVELRRLLRRDTVDLGAVKAKMKEIEDIRVELNIKKIETLLRAISALTHEQHTQVILLARDLESTDKPRAPVY